MINLKNEECTGCEACVNICPVGCIQMIQDNEGFYYPKISEENCISCDKCSTVCNKRIDTILSRRIKKAFAGFSRDEEIRKASSSGGLFSELSIYVLNLGGIVYGAAYDDNLLVNHIRIENVQELKRLRGSKYVQSRIGNVYKDVLNDLNNRKMVLFSGTPCQINGLYRYLGIDFENLISCSIICHGVPSPYVFKRYLGYLEGRMGSNVRNVEFRNKDVEGWKEFRIKYTFDDNTEYYKIDEDIYYKGFLENIYLRKSCYKCYGKEKAEVADIILGDFWGIESFDHNINSYYGVNAVVVNSEKGFNIVKLLSNRCDIHEVKYQDIVKNNSALEESVKHTIKRNHFFDALEETKDIFGSINDNLKWQPTDDNKAIQLYPIISKYFKKIIDGITIGKILEKLNKKRILLYANTELMQYCLYDIKRNAFHVYLSDSNFNLLKNQFTSEDVIEKSQILPLYLSGNIDAIIVCSLTFENVIIQDFISNGIKQEDIYSLLEFIYTNSEE